MKPLDVFNSNWFKVSNPKIKDYRVVENLILGNGKVANVAIYCGDVCIAYGNYYDDLKYPENENSRSYFHGNHGFMGCGTSSRFWFYFNDDVVILNDHGYNYPFDELMKNYSDFFERITA